MPTDRFRKVNWRLKDVDLVEKIDRIVEAKKASGIQSTFSYELMRLARVGLFKNLIGHEIDQQVLGKLKMPGE